MSETSYNSIFKVPQLMNQNDDLIFLWCLEVQKHDTKE